MNNRFRILREVLGGFDPVLGGLKRTWWVWLLLIGIDMGMIGFVDCSGLALSFCATSVLVCYVQVRKIGCTVKRMQIYV
jgi:hypothetical protein